MFLSGESTCSFGNKSRFLDQADGKAWQRLGKLPSCVNMAEAGKYLSNSSMIIPAYTN